MKWRKSKLGGCFAIVADVINIEVYRSFALDEKWTYSVFQRRTQHFNTMREAKKAAIEYVQQTLTKALTEIDKEGTP